MKKVAMICIVACLTMGMSGNAVLASEDFSSYTYDELLELRQALDDELLSRPEYVQKSFSSGEYIAGEDLPAGEYTLTLKQEDPEFDRVDYYVYETKDMYSYDVNRLFLGDMPIKEGSLKADSTATVNLYEGYCLVIRYNGVNVQQTGKLEGNPNDTYEVPDGTLIPAGFYTVGVEIPEGIYTAYYSGDTTTRFRIYRSMEEASNDFVNEEFELILSLTNPSGPVTLEEGHVIRIEYSDVIMTKREAFTFD